MRHTRREFLGTAAAGTTGLLAGCAGTGGSQETTDSETTMPSTTTAEAATDSTDSVAQQTDLTLTVRTHPEQGVILADGSGMTLYRFTQDPDGESVCYDDCASAWPPLTVEGSPSVPDGLPGEVGTIERDGGSTQVTYNDRPLYSFQSDQEPGDVTGQGVNDVWFVVRPACAGAGSGSGTTTDDSMGGTTTDGGNGGGPDY